MDNFLIVPLSILVELPRLLAELYEDVHLGAPTPVDGLRLARHDSCGESITAPPDSLDFRTDRPSREVDLLPDVNGVPLERHAEAPHVRPAEVLRESQLEVVDMRYTRVGELVLASSTSTSGISGLTLITSTSDLCCSLKAVATESGTCI
jgi:hypothetical protein